MRVIESQETKVDKDQAKEIQDKTLEALLEQLKFLKVKISFMMIFAFCVGKITMRI